MVPASEVPVWETHFEREPWGFNALDKLFSKNAMHIAQSNGAKSELTVQDLMFSDRFDSLQLNENEIAALSEQERNFYLRKRLLKRFKDLELSQDEFDELCEADQNDYAKRHVEQLKKVLGNG